MHRIDKRICSGKATCDRTIDAGAVGCIRVTFAAINRRGDVTCRLFDHDDAIVRFAVVTAGAVVRDASSSMVKCQHCETGEPGVMAHQTILPRRWQRHVCHRPARRCQSVMAGNAGRR